MKLLIVDDSIVYRTAISQALQDVPGYEIVRTCSNGKIAIDFLKQNPDIDLITLDMEMPVMDGMETIKEIRKFNNKVGIIVFSAITVRGAENTIDALSSGANDFVTKIEGKGTIESSLEMIKQELVPKIDAIYQSKIKKNSTVVSGKTSERGPVSPISTKTTGDNLEPEYLIESDLEQIVLEMKIKPKLLCIGSSTGGPEALTALFSSLKEKPSIPMLLVQHMPPMFTKKLAESLDAKSVVTVKEAIGGESLEAGVCYVAPGDYHMTLNKDLTLSLNQEEKVCFVRPAVNVLFNSVCENYGSQIMTIILTGMGDDGADASLAMKKKGAYQFIQDKESSIVWGMPGSVFKKNVGAKVIKLSDFSILIDLISKRI